MNGDSVENPKHYTELWPQPIVVIENWGLNFSRGAVLKYLARAGRKNDELEDLKKCRWFIEREIQRLERNQEVAGPGKGDGTSETLEPPAPALVDFPDGVP